jgi:hypothetical protein
MKMMEFSNIRLSTNPTLSGRKLIYVDILYSGETYNWAVYIPKDYDIEIYLNEKSTDIEKDILSKEEIWLTTEKTKIINDPIFGDMIININKNEIVKPTIPDDLEVDPTYRIQELESTVISLIKILNEKGTL